MVQLEVCLDVNSIEIGLFHPVEIADDNHYWVGLGHESLHVDVVIERLQALQRSEEIIQIRQFPNLQKNRLELVDQTHRKHDNSQSPHRNDQIKHVLDHLSGEAVDVEGHKPLADPHGGVHSQFDEHVRV